MVKLVVFLIIFTILFIALIIGFFSDDIKNALEKKNHKKNVYKNLHNFVEENDQLLINNACFYFKDDPSIAHYIDHILICDKYVYIIKDYVNEGGIFGNIVDPHLFKLDKHNNKHTIDNPVLQNLEMVEKIEKLTNIDHDEHLYVSVVVYNNSLVVPKGISIKNQNSWFIPLKDLTKTIKTAEEDDIQPLQTEKSQRLAVALKDRSDEIKKRLIESQSKQKK